MKFLYVHAWDFKAIKDCGFNLDCRYRFEVRGGKLRRSLLRADFPPHFFSVGGLEHQNVENVSVVCGANGSGKTTVATVIAALVSGVAPTNASCLAIIEIASGDCEIHYLGPKFSSEKKIQDFIGFEDNGKMCKWVHSYPRIDMYAEKGRDSLSRRCDFVYYSPLFTTERVITGDGWKPGNAFSIYDCSTTAQYDLVTSHDLHFGGSGMRLFRAHERVSAFRMLYELRQKGFGTSFNESDAPLITLKLTIRGDRVISAADSFDDKTHRYAFNQALSMDEMIEGLRANAGRLFGVDHLDAQPECCVFFTWAVLQLLPAIGRGGDEKVRYGSFHYDLIDRAFGIFEDEQVISRILDEYPEEESMIPEELRLMDSKFLQLRVGIGQLMRLLQSDRFDFSYEVQSRKGGKSADMCWKIDCNTDEDIEFACCALSAYAKAGMMDPYVEVGISPELSSGVAAYLSMWGRINWYFQGAQEDPRREKCKVNKEVIIFMDEAETALHPLWQRSLVKETIRFCELFGAGRQIHLIFGTHSPMILSDVPKGNVVFLKSNAKQIELDAGIAGGDTFGANIFDLYRNSFFLEKGTVGEFASDKINGALCEVAAAVKETAHTHKKKSLSKETRGILDLVGDDGLQRYLLDLRDAQLI